MNSLDHNILNSLVIEQNSSILIETYQVEILAYLGQFTTDVYYFQVNIVLKDCINNIGELGLLRIGQIDGGLSRELKLRELITDYKLIAPLLASRIVDSITINLNLPDIEKQYAEEEHLDEQSAYLDELYYNEQETISNSSSQKLLLLNYFPDQIKTLETWLNLEHTPEESLVLVSQVCQFLRYVHQHNWCLISIIPQLVQMTTLIQFFDLTNAYPVGEVLPSRLSGDYCAPELGYDKTPINELMSSYTVGALLYHAIHQQPLQIEQTIDIQVKPIPRIYQLLKISLSPIPEERFTLSQLLGILVETRHQISTPKIHWQFASSSTIGLSIKRLQNEDSYGVRQQQVSNTETIILAVVADGMGGMSQGELASKIAVETVLEELIPTNLKTVEQRHEWLISLVQKANESVANKVKDGGTTLSMIFAVAQQLMIAHVGDSRIYLLRQAEIRQISQDHSLIALLIASEQITEEESLVHPDRNILTKFIGSKRRLSDGYIQDLRSITQELSITLENEDILLLCSDGVWDLVPTNELAEIFSQHQDLQLSVDQIMNHVLERGAFDTATLLAIQCLFNVPVV